ncbi:MAG: type I restriction endonuclease [Xanthobacteraceae bacterium]
MADRDLQLYRARKAGHRSRGVMSAGTFTESIVEEAALGWLEALGYAVLHGPSIAAGEPAAERKDPNYRDVILEYRLQSALARLNADLPSEALEDAYRKLIKLDAPSLIERNRALHRMLVDGVTVEYRRKDGSIAGAQARVIDFDDADNNDWLAVNQFTVAEGQTIRRPDVVLFVNGLPLAVIELKNAADENADIWAAFKAVRRLRRRRVHDDPKIFPRRKRRQAPGVVRPPQHCRDRR